MSLNTLIQRTQQTFIRYWDYSPSLTVQAPGRVNLIGEHTDYNEGFVLPCTINFHTVISGAKRHDHQVRVIAADYKDQQDIFSLLEPIIPHPTQGWSNYVRGVIKYLQIRAPQFSGADLVISGNIPQGAGLSSSAALEMAVGQFFQALYQLPLDGIALALNGQEAENKFVGCHCGIMDQLISALGKKAQALLIDCRSLETHPVAMSPELAVVIINSNVKRGLVDSEYNIRRQQCEAAATFFRVKALRDVSLDEFNARHALDEVIARRARHVITENQRTLAAANALATNDLIKMGQLMAQSHASMRDDFEISVKPIDTLVDIVKTVVGEHGGARMTGGGFGGCVVALVPQNSVADICDAVERRYPIQTGLNATFYLCQPTHGASVC